MVDESAAAGVEGLRLHCSAGSLDRQLLLMGRYIEAPGNQLEPGLLGSVGFYAARGFRHSTEVPFTKYVFL